VKSAASIAVMVVGLSALSADAKPPLPYQPSPAELAMLPEACQARLGPDYKKNPAIKSTWSSRYGMHVWIHIHHYCHGLKFMNRAQFGQNAQHRSFYLRSAIGEFDYVLDKWPQGSQLIGEAQGKKAQAELLLKLQK
jgi:hypothetical protein